MKKLLILLIVLFISISAVSASQDITDDVIGDASNILVYEDEGTTPQNDDSNENILISDEGASSAGVQDTSNITIQGDDLVWYYKANPVYNFKILDGNGSGIMAENVSVVLNDVSYNVNTDENGTGKLPISLNAGYYIVNVTYANQSIANIVKLFSSRVTSKDVSSTYGTMIKYPIRVLDNAANPLVNATVTFKIDDRVFYKKTDEHGIAYITLKASAGKYKIKYYVDGLSGSNIYKVTNKIAMRILNWGLKGDVSKAPLIKKNMPNNAWVKKAVLATKKGIPLLAFKGGKGKVIFMTAGVHGNELNSQVAAMKLIKYLSTHPIKGTVYIMPFVNVKAISQRVRLTNYDFNRVAHVPKTVSNNIVKLVLKYKCDAYGDFHTTVSPGVPGINVVLGYTSSKYCISLTNYIAKNAKVNKIFYYPGQKYTWSLADWTNYQGTPAVICEVISPVNAVSSGATSLSFKQMAAFLKFNSMV